MCKGTLRFYSNQTIISPFFIPNSKDAVNSKSCRHLVSIIKTDSQEKKEGIKTGGIPTST